MCCLKETHLKYEGRSLKSKRIEEKIHSVNTDGKKIRGFVLKSHDISFRPVMSLGMKMAITR